MSSFFTKVQELASIDLRSLALFRMALGLLVAVDAFRRGLDLNYFYTDAGVLPRAVAIDELGFSAFFWSLYYVNGQAWWAGGLLLLTLLCGFSLMLGYRTRLATVLTWVLVLSVQNRNPLVLGDGDTLVRLLLFWSIFLPLGAKWSLDQFHRPAKLQEESASTPQLMQVCSLASLALLLQVIYVYFFSALLKQSPDWIPDGSALLVAFSHPFYATSLGQSLVAYPEFLKGLTYLVYYSELILPWLVFLPFFNGPIRTFVVVYFLGFHLLGVGLTLHVGLIIWAAAVAWLVFLPAWFWESCVPALGKTPVISYLVQLIESLSENVAQLALGTDRAIRTVDNYEARPLTERFPPGLATILDSVTGCLVLLALVYVTLWNCRTVEYMHNRMNRDQPDATLVQTILPSHYNAIGDLLRIGQYWNNLAPRPDRKGGYFIIKGETFLGDPIYPFRRVASNLPEGPESSAAGFPNELWRHYFERFRQRSAEAQRRAFGRYLTKTYNGRRPLDEAMKSFTIQYVETFTGPNGQQHVSTKTLWQHRCYTEAQEKKIMDRLQGVLRERARGSLQSL